MALVALPKKRKYEDVNEGRGRERKKKQAIVSTSFFWHWWWRKAERRWPKRKGTRKEGEASRWGEEEERQRAQRGTQSEERRTRWKDLRDSKWPDVGRNESNHRSKCLIMSPGDIWNCGRYCVCMCVCLCVRSVHPRECSENHFHKQGRLQSSQVLTNYRLHWNWKPALWNSISQTLRLILQLNIFCRKKIRHDTGEEWGIGRTVLWLRNSAINEAVEGKCVSGV